MSYPKHIRLKFGAYSQTQKEHSNDMEAQTIGAACLGPTGNAQGSHWFLSLESRARVTWTRWTEMPMPQEAIHRVNQLGKSQGMPWNLSFGNLHVNKIDDALSKVSDDDSDESSFLPNSDAAADIDDSVDDVSLSYSLDSLPTSSSSSSSSDTSSSSFSDSSSLSSSLQSTLCIGLLLKDIMGGPSGVAYRATPGVDRKDDSAPSFGDASEVGGGPIA